VQFWFLADDSHGLLRIPDALDESAFRRFVKYAVAP